MKIPAFKLELEMKISAFESSFERRGSQMGFRNWGRDAPFFVYCGWVSEKISFRKVCNASEMAYNASERALLQKGL